MSYKNLRNLCALIVGCCVTSPICWAEQQAPKEKAGPRAQGTQCKVVIVQHADCEKVAQHVRCLFETEKNERPYKASWFAQANAVMLRGSPQEIAQMEYLISQIDVFAFVDIGALLGGGGDNVILIDDVVGEFRTAAKAN